MKKKKLWFRAKYYGYGWYPVTWQGWLVTLLFIFYQIGLVGFISNSFDSRSGVTSYFFLTFLGIVTLMTICYKFGETPKWRWGKDK